MTCVPFKTAEGVRGIVCFRGRKHRTCQAVDRAKGKLCRAPVELLCDGCDLPVCASCTVQVEHSGKPRDFCSGCFLGVWAVWLRAIELGHLPTAPADRMQRRAAFRVWAKRNPEFFAELKLSKAGAA